jgi:PAS domain S-box-containing protein
VQFGYLLAIAGSFALLLYRFFNSISASEQIATRLMLTGIGLAFGPGIVLVSLPNLLQFSLSGVVGITLAALAIPALPLFYVYAIYKRQLGQLEFRANRLLSIYSFVLLYPTVFIILFFLGWQSFLSASGRMVYLLVISIVFVVTAPPLLSRFQRLVNRLAYASEHDPDDVIRVFAHQIPSVRTREALVDLITRQIVPTLLIRQSALGFFEDDGITYLYEQSVPPDAAVRSKLGAQYLLQDAPVYRAPMTEPVAESDWVRLVVPLQTREETIGIWLLGKRDPDDFYPRDDVDLFQILANQIATVIENISLYETLRRHADSLPEQVAIRTGELRAERDRTQAILDSAGEGVFFADMAGTILYVNPTMTRLTGYSVEEMLGQSLQLWAAPDENTDRTEMWEAVREGRPWNGEMVQRRKDLSTYDVNLTISPLQTAEGDVSGFVGVQSDISKLKEIDRLKTNIIANVSHELKTPLTNISLYLSLLRRNKSGRTEEYLNVLERESKRLTQLIQNLLDLSKLDTGAIPTHLTPLDVSSSVVRTVATFQSMAQDKRIALTCDLPDQLPAIVADDAQIEQVLTNLVGNALSYTPIGGSVNVSVGEAEHRNSPAVYIRVADTGMGIAPADMPHLFDRFYRGAANNDGNVPGTGLGLAICKEIVDRHDGHIDVVSQQGQGATFTVWLPTANGLIMEAAGSVTE